eukprot:TRINITY_DN3644_c0_g1_i4.p1 TRINITY_DN3644_c0_g1~~TRINITY_DN3644_c0_g1_i4.p1  ORF type:complete len:108 (+),score=22.51 TRINITY_DN3644_c0_g1_i4:1-324(+)
MGVRRFWQANRFKRSNHTAIHRLKNNKGTASKKSRLAKSSHAPKRHEPPLLELEGTDHDDVGYTSESDEADTADIPLIPSPTSSCPSPTLSSVPSSPSPGTTSTRAP